MRRATLLLSIGVIFAACDTGERGICVITPEGNVVSRVLAPEDGDSIRIGEPFVFRAEYEGEGNVTEVGVELKWNLFENDPEPFQTDSLLFVQALGEGPGRYRVEEEIVIDSLRGVSSVHDLDPDGYFVIGAYGKVQFPDCGGAGGSRSANYNQVTLLDRNLFER